MNRGGENRRLIIAMGMSPDLEAETLGIVESAERMSARMGQRFVIDPVKLKRYGAAHRRTGW